MALALVFVSTPVFVWGCVFAPLYVHTRFMVNKRRFFLAKASRTLIRSLLVVLPQHFGRRISVERPTFVDLDFVSRSDTFQNDVDSF